MAETLRNSKAYTCGKELDYAVSTWQDVPVLLCTFVLTPILAAAFLSMHPLLLLLSPAGSRAGTDTKLRSDPCWQKWGLYLRPVAGVVLQLLLQPVRYSLPDPAWSAKLVIALKNVATKWGITKITLLELLQTHRMWECGCVWVCVWAKFLTLCTWIPKLIFMYVYITLVAYVQVYVCTVLFSEPVAMVPNSLRSYCWRTGHLLETEAPQRDREEGGNKGAWEKRGLRKGDKRVHPQAEHHISFIH